MSYPFSLRDWTIVLLLVCAPAPFCGAQTHEFTVFQKNGPATLSLSARKKGDVARMQLADNLFVTVAIDGSPTLQARWPKVLNTKTWRIRDKYKPVKIKVGEKQIQWRQTVELVPLLPGENDLLLLPVHYRDGEGEWRKASWTAIAVVVQTQITDPKLENARDITGIERLPKKHSPPRERYWIAIAVILILAAVAAFWIIRKRRRISTPVLSANVWANGELERLQRLGLPEKGEGTRYVTLVANVVRGFLEKRLDLPARRRTTPEFLQTLAGSEKLNPDQSEFLRDFLTRCDLIKYSNAEPTEQDCNELFHSAKRIIDALKPHEPPEAE